MPKIFKVGLLAMMLNMILLKGFSVVPEAPDGDGGGGDKGDGNNGDGNNGDGGDDDPDKGKTPEQLAEEVKAMRSHSEKLKRERDNWKSKASKLESDKTQEEKDREERERQKQENEGQFKNLYETEKEKRERIEKEHQELRKQVDRTAKLGALRQSLKSQGFKDEGQNFDRIAKLVDADQRIIKDDQSGAYYGADELAQEVKKEWGDIFFGQGGGPRPNHSGTQTTTKKLDISSANLGDDVKNFVNDDDNKKLSLREKMKKLDKEISN